MERDTVGVRERGKETVEVAHLFEHFLDGSLAVVEVDKDIRLVFVLGECFYDGALANSSGPFDEEGFAALGFGFLLQQLLVDFAFKFNHLYASADENINKYC